MAKAHGRRWMSRLHRNQNPARWSVLARPTKGTRQRSMLVPTKPSMAGRRVTDPIIVTSTTAAEPTATPSRNGRFIRSMPRTEMTTVVPAKRTARPAVLMATTVARSGSMPACRPSR